MVDGIASKLGRRGLIMPCNLQGHQLVETVVKTYRKDVALEPERVPVARRYSLDNTWPDVKSLTDQSESGCGRKFARIGVFAAGEREELPGRSSRSYERDDESAHRE